MNVNIRQAKQSDAIECSRIIHVAFKGIADRHRFPHDFPSVEAAHQMTQVLFNNPDIEGVVAEGQDGSLLGSNFLWKQNTVHGVGPISVDPNLQGHQIGRRLMEAVIERGRRASGIRLVQDAFNTTSMSLYARLGFDVMEPLALIAGTPQSRRSKEVEVRPLQEKDYEACGELCRKIHGFDRNNEMKQLAQMFPPVVAVRENRVVAYATAPNFWQMNHAVASSSQDLRELLLGASEFTGQPLSFLLPTRHTELFRWCLREGLRMIKPMSLMSMGEYREPRGDFLPSVLY